MKRISLLIIVLFVAFSAAAQQKIAYIYSEKVFNAMPEYKSAVTELEQYASSAQTTAEEKLKSVQRKFVEYKQIEGSLSNEMRTTMRNEIVRLEQEANTYEEKFFEEGGAMNKRRDKLMKPLEEKVVNAINQLAESENYDMILDLSVAKIALYQSPTLDLTQKIINIVNNN